MPRIAVSGPSFPLRLGRLLLVFTLSVAVQFREHGRINRFCPALFDCLDHPPNRIFVFAFEEPHRRECGVFPIDFDAEPVSAEGLGNDSRRIRPRENIDYQVAGFRQEVDEERRQSEGKSCGVPFFAEGLDDAHVVGVAVGIGDLQQIRGDRSQIAVLPEALRYVVA